MNRYNDDNDDVRVGRFAQQDRETDKQAYGEMRENIHITDSKLSKAKRSQRGNCFFPPPSHDTEPRESSTFIHPVIS